MRRWLTIVCWMLITQWACSSGYGAYLEQGEGVPPRRPTPIRPRPPIRPPIRPPVRPPVPPNGQQILYARASDLSVGWPATHNQMTVYPLKGRDLNFPAIFSLQQALSRGYIWIEETGQVGSLAAHNRSPHFVFLMLGEIVGGGWQNRTLAEDTLLGPWAEGVRLPVYCVEKGRWRGGREQFSSIPEASPPCVRRKVAQGATQEEVWSEVDRLSERAGGRSPTHDLSQCLRSAPCYGEIDETVRAIEGRLPKGTVGIMVFCGNRLVGIDLFGSQHLFSQLRSELLRSYAWDVFGEHPPWWSRMGRIGANRLLDRLRRANATCTGTPGDGCGLDVWGEGLQGHGVALGGSVLHLHLY